MDFQRHHGEAVGSCPHNNNNNNNNNYNNNNNNSNHYNHSNNKNPRQVVIPENKKQKCACCVLQ